VTLDARLEAGAGQVGAPVHYTVVNHTADTVFVASCCDRALVLAERRVGSEWQSYTSGACIDICPYNPVRVLPHDSVQDSLTISSAGTYRFRLDVFRTWRGGSPATITSAAFTVR
jgi:hypothetical protein